MLLTFREEKGGNREQKCEVRLRKNLNRRFLGLRVKGKHREEDKFFFKKCRVLWRLQIEGLPTIGYFLVSISVNFVLQSNCIHKLKTQ